MNNIKLFILLITVSISLTTCDVEEYNFCRDEPLGNTLFGFRIVDADGNDPIYNGNYQIFRIRLYIESTKTFDAIRYYECNDATKQCTFYIENIAYDLEEKAMEGDFLFSKTFFEVDTLNFSVEKTTNSCDTEYFNILNIEKGGELMERAGNIFLIKN